MTKAEYKRQYRIKHRERLNEERRIAYSINRDVILAQQRQYYKDGYKDVKKEYKALNKSKIDSYNKEYYEKNKSIILEVKKNRFDQIRDIKTLEKDYVNETLTKIKEIETEQMLIKTNKKGFYSNDEKQKLSTLLCKKRNLKNRLSISKEYVAIVLKVPLEDLPEDAYKIKKASLQLKRILKPIKNKK